MVSSDYYDQLAVSNRTRTVTTSAPRGRILDRNGVELVRNRASLAVTAYRDLADDPVLVRHLANVLGMPMWPFAATSRTIPRVRRPSIRSRPMCAARPLPTFKSTLASSRVSTLPIARSASTLRHPRLPCARIHRHHHLRATPGAGGGRADRGQHRIPIRRRGGQAGVESRYERLLQGIRGEQTVTIDASGNVTGQVGRYLRAQLRYPPHHRREYSEGLRRRSGVRHRGCASGGLRQRAMRRLRVPRLHERRDPRHGERAHLRSVGIRWWRLV